MVLTTTKQREVEKLAHNLLNEFGLHDWSFGWSKAKTAYGDCNENKKLIRLSKVLAPKLSDDAINDTIRHEIAHARVGVVQGHNVLWKMEAVKCGASPQRLGPPSPIRGKHVLQCVNCGLLYYRHRAVKKTLACGKCCKKYNSGFYHPDYKLMSV